MRSKLNSRSGKLNFLVRFLMDQVFQFSTFFISTQHPTSAPPRLLTPYTTDSAILVKPLVASIVDKHSCKNMSLTQVRTHHGGAHRGAFSRYQRQMRCLVSLFVSVTGVTGANSAMRNVERLLLLVSYYLI